MAMRVRTRARPMLRRCLATFPACGVPACKLCGEATEPPLSQRASVSALGLDRPVSVCFESIHGRQMWRDVASIDECRRAADATRAAMIVASDTDGDGRIFPPDAPTAESYLGAGGLALILSMRERVDERVHEQYGSVERAGCLLSWISGRSKREGVRGGEQAQAQLPLRSFNWLTDPISGTFAPHVDRANVPEYEISTLLYLSTAGVDFEGGAFAFNDPDADRLVEPSAGMLLAFCSGFRNLHQVRPVSFGERFVLSTWYRRSSRATD